MSSAAQATIQLERRQIAQDQRPANADVVIGKDILELLSTAMYVDSLTVFREYIQNSADAIDEAFDTAILSEGDLATISIDLDPIARDIRIRDNGIGLKPIEAEKVLTAFGASGKRQKRARGFRGVGRLAALGYCQFLTFRTKAAGEACSTEVRWDCRKLKTILHDPHYSGSLGRVVNEVVSITSMSASEPSDHFFEVHLEKVIRIKNDVLLNAEAIRRYVSQVAPLPFHEEFSHRNTLGANLRRYIEAPRFRILMNPSDGPLTRPFRDTIEVTKEKTETVSGFEWIELRDSDESLRAVGWILNHAYSGALHGSPGIRGLRARVGDIQIGGEDIFAQVFPEERFNSWTVGEIHILDPKVVPNGRRDNFEHNTAYHSLIGQLVPIGRSLTKRCRISSARRNRIKRFQWDEQHVQESLRTLAQNSLGKQSARAVRRDIAARLAQMEVLVGGNLIIEDDRADLGRRLVKLRGKFGSLDSSERAPDPFRSVPPKRRAIYEEVIGLIYECATNRVAAKALVDRLIARLSAT
jgi:molecular chaperone HtpG